MHPSSHTLNPIQLRQSRGSLGDVQSSLLCPFIDSYCKVNCEPKTKYINEWTSDKINDFMAEQMNKPNDTIYTSSRSHTSI